VARRKHTEVTYYGRSIGTDLRSFELYHIRPAPYGPHLPNIREGTSFLLFCDGSTLSRLELDSLILSLAIDRVT